jgi:serpin B
MGPAALDAYNAVDRALRERRTNGVILRSANAVFARRGLRFQQAFVDGLAAHFPVGLSALDFVGAPNASRVAINRWVSDVTEAKIPELFRAGDIHSDTRMVLVNATYFYGPWKHSFDPAQTQPGPFSLRDGSSAQVSKMSRAFAARSASSDGWRAVEIPYANEQLSMVVIVPSDGDVSALEASLGDGRWSTVSSALDALPASQLEVLLPKFRFVHRAELSARLAAMGASEAFSARADFSGVSADVPMRIEQVIHSTFIAVDERGTDAAAATGITFGPTSIAPVRQFDVDRPFVFVIRDVQTGAPLFVGHVLDPRPQ